ncbi:uncharacterized protein LOC129774686 [Toxorhynchites rutilus septentrionalis]|uniref:uncharacterized protein LOC129774686 n=1 Tax=Toxorhynchites rutilus septentrionalis TaxID=329112 RepID=UPI002478B234|nr:uncharacterized protein LOC129774686 [Toxorhynchites rutilus septentrionalis]
MDTVLQIFSKWFSKLSAFDNDVDQFFLMKLPDIVIGLYAETWEGTRKVLWRTWQLVYLVMFLHHAFALVHAMQDKDYYDNVIQAYYMLFTYIIVASQIYTIKSIRKELEIIRGFVNLRKTLRYDERAFKKRARGFRNINMITLSPILLTIVMMPLLFVSGTVLTPEYVWNLQLGEGFELLSNGVLVLSVAVLSYVTLVSQLCFNFINTLLCGLTTEAEILGDFFSDLESRVVAAEMNRVGMSVLASKDLRLNLLSFRNELKNCVELQQELLECIRCLKRITEPLTFILYYMSFFYIAECICLGFYGKRSIIDASFMVFALYYMIQCCIMCYLLERLEDENQRIAFITYSLSWPNNLNFSRENVKLSKEIRAMILFTVQRANEPLNFSCGGFFPVTMARFGDMLQMTYALITLLNTNF